MRGSSARTPTKDCSRRTSGLDGKIESGYGWYGGVYGWDSRVVQIPSRARWPTARRSSGLHYGFANALLLTGERRYVDLWRRMLDLVNAKARMRTAGRCTRTCTGGSTGWIDCSRAARSTTCHARAPRAGTSSGPSKFSPGAVELYYWTLDRTALDLLPAPPPWVRYLDGEDPAYPDEALQADLEQLRSKVERMRADVRDAGQDDVGRPQPG